MTAIELYQIIEGWKNATYLKECSLVLTMISIQKH